MFKVSFHFFKELSPEQWHEIISIRSSVFVSEQKCAYTDPDSIDLKALHFIVVADKSIIAYARVFCDINWHIGRVVTQENYRKQGVSKTLLMECIEFIKKQDDSMDIIISSQVYLTGFYQKLGFKIEGRMYLEDGIPHLLMRYQRHSLFNL